MSAEPDDVDLQQRATIRCSVIDDISGQDGRTRSAWSPASFLVFQGESNSKYPAGIMTAAPCSQMNGAEMPSLSRMHSSCALVLLGAQPQSGMS